MRPDNWEETTFNLGFATPYKSASNELRAFSDGIESGADAMLEALKANKGEYVDCYIHSVLRDGIYVEVEESGWLIFLEVEGGKRWLRSG